jgi:hypothetical protein
MRNGILGVMLVIAGTTMAVTTAVSSGDAGRAAAATAPHGLPNLTMRKITDIEVAPYYSNGTETRNGPAGEAIAGRWAIRFSSVVDNKGRGPLVIKAHRARVGQPCAPTTEPTNRCEVGDMTADQLVVLANGKTRRYRNVGRVYFDELHYHWHLRNAERYELRNAAGRNVTRDAKTGFCFGDRLTSKARKPVHYPGLETGLTTCRYGSSDPKTDGRRALTLTEGISAGWSDDYPNVENGKPLQGQQLELTGLPAGNYVLVNRANATGKFRETTKKDNATSALFALSWPDGTDQKPVVKILRHCVGKATCKPR